MRYYVLADDGQKYGPADLATLNQWIGEGRLTQQQMLEEETTGRKVAVTSVTGLNWVGPEAAPGGGYQGYYRGPVMMGDDGAGDLKNAWIFAVLAFLCCPIVFGILGIVYSMRAKTKGNPAWVGPFAVSIIGMIVGWGIGMVTRTSIQQMFR